MLWAQIVAPLQLGGERELHNHIVIQYKYLVVVTMNNPYIIIRAAARGGREIGALPKKEKYGNGRGLYSSLRSRAVGTDRRSAPVIVVVL